MVDSCLLVMIWAFMRMKIHYDVLDNILFRLVFCAHILKWIKITRKTKILGPYSVTKTILQFSFCILAQALCSVWLLGYLNISGYWNLHNYSVAMSFTTTMIRNEFL